ncbi:MAG: hypothetical protein ACRD2L_25885, partial [Terriglobia bacterium]
TQDRKNQAKVAEGKDMGEAEGTEGKLKNDFEVVEYGSAFEVRRILDDKVLYCSNHVVKAQEICEFLNRRDLTLIERTPLLTQNERESILAEVGTP